MPFCPKCNGAECYLDRSGKLVPCGACKNGFAPKKTVPKLVSRHGSKRRPAVVA